jgi:hypothetical protein
VLYWRWIGRNCNPNDLDQCERWDKDYRWYLEDVDYSRSVPMRVTVEFDQDKALLPWEEETLHVHFDGRRVWVTYPDAAFSYSESAPAFTGRDEATISLSPLGRNLRPPEAGKVRAHLELRSGQLKLVIDDERASFYAGETLEVRYSLWKSQHASWKNWFGRDSKLLERDENNPERLVVDAADPRQVIDVSVPGRDELYVKWAFRRAASKVSSGEWMERDETNRVNP